MNNETDRKDRASGSGRIRKVLLWFFCAAFILSAAMYGYDRWGKHEAADSYDRLQTVRQSAMTVAGGEQGGASASEEAGEKKKPLISLDFTELKEINPEIVAWIWSEGGLDYPITQTTDNEFYLTHLSTGAKNPNGAIFMDYKNDPKITDRNTVIYGHNLNNGTLFGHLPAYRFQSHYDRYPTMYLYTPEASYRIELLAGTVEDAEHSFLCFEFRNEEEVQDYVDTYMVRSTFEPQFRLQPGDQLITLCTCAYDTRDARYVLVGRLVQLWEE